MEACEHNRILELLTEDFELRKLYETHQMLEDRLSKFEHGGFLTTAEEMERKRLKKRKLFGVDQMMQIVASHDVAA